MAGRPQQTRGPRRTAPQRYAVIMAGGHGTRFWPRSRRRIPKQLLRITGARTLLQATVERLRPLFTWQRILVVTTREQAAAVRRQLPHVPDDHVLVEPVGRNTAPCIALAAEWIVQRSSEALMVVAPADHIVTDQRGFQRTLLAACDLAATHECLVTLGVRPTRPDTGFGYIEVGAAIGRGVANAHWVRRFREKPSAAIAGRYVATGRHLWNSGIFVWRAAVFRTALGRTLPRVRQALDGLWRGTERTVTRRLRRTYPRLPAISVDSGLMQPIATMRSAAPRVAVLRAGFDWNDVGSWSAMPEIWGCDQAGNAAVGKVLPVGASGSIVYSPDRLVALIGTRDLIVVDSPDALLICARQHAQDVRKITRALKQRRWTRYL